MKQLLAAISAAVVLLCAGMSFAAAVTVKAEGSAIKSGDESEARAKAIEDALGKSVEEAVKLLIKDEMGGASSGVLKKSFPDPSRYILNYRILSEGLMRHFDMPADTQRAARPSESEPSGGIEAYHVWIEANVNIDGLRRDVEGLGGAGRGEAMVTIEILGLDDYHTFERLKQRIKAIEIVRAVYYRSFSRGRAVLSVVVAGGGNGFLKRLSSEFGNDFTVLLAGEERVVIKKEKKEN